MNALNAKVMEMFMESPRCPRIQKIDPSMLLLRFRKTMSQLLRHQAILLVQFRRGHVPMQKYLYRIGKAESSKCPTCKTDDKTVHHLLLMCPAYMEQRKQLATDL